MPEPSRPSSPRPRRPAGRAARLRSLAAAASLAPAAALGAQPVRKDAPPAPAARAEQVRYPHYAGDSARAPWRVDVRATGAPGMRRFVLATTAPQRDGAPGERTVVERPGAPFVVSGSALFDALFAVAVDDARQASVEVIRDDAYQGGAPIACHCFETGEQWHYVWTRDLAYALDLGLAGFDPPRAVASLRFKTSGFRPGVAVPPELPDGSTQVIEDTGSGGSWPVSTDRVVWALGAGRTLAALDGAARAAFAREAYQALRGTLEADRVAAYDAATGLYTGEHSFLDWREQTYAPWITDDLAAMARTRALSTNVAALAALRLAARLAGEVGAPDVGRRYGAWADSLRGAIDQVFWHPEAGLYATFTVPDRAATPVAKYDLLGNALAILAGVADAERAREILSRYPFAPFGAPVVWPQAPGEFVYHNRALWPFVTAYALRAAAHAGHVAAADRALASLVRGSALHLSNMENLEWLTGLSRFDDGPAINSRRQLWSVGGYLGAVAGTVFGWHADGDSVRVAPFLTAATRALLGAAPTARLGGLSHRGRPVEIVLALPAAAPAGGVHDVRTVRLNGTPVPATFPAALLQADGNRIEVDFAPARPSGDAVTTIPVVPARSHDDPRVFMPRTPTLRAARRADGTVDLTLEATAGAAPVTHRLLRDGRPVADGVTWPAWRDPAPPPATHTVCYAAVAVHAAPGVPPLASHPSAPACLRGTLAQTIDAADPRVGGVPLVPAGDSVARATRGLALGTRLVVAEVAIAAAGEYAIAAEYDNHVFAHNTGVTNAVKRLTITGPDGVRHGGIVQMPHVRPAAGRYPIRRSTPVHVRLAPGRHTIELSDFFNMSALAANASYSGPGGRTGPVNAAGIAAITIDAVGDGGR